MSHFTVKYLDTSKKPTLILTTSLLIAEASIENTLLALDWVSYILYPIWFKNDEVWAFINSNNKVNIMTLIYAAKLDLKVRYIDVEAQKINSCIFETFRMVLANF